MMVGAGQSQEEGLTAWKRNGETERNQTTMVSYSCIFFLREKKEGLKHEGRESEIITPVFHKDHCGCRTEGEIKLTG